MSRSRTLLATGAALTLIWALTGCTSGAPAPAPAVSADSAECGEVMPIVNRSMDLITSGMQAIGTDDAAATADLNSAVTTAQEAADSVGTSDVAHTVRTFAQGVTEYRDAVVGLIAHPEVATDEAFTSLTTTLLGTTDGLMTMCPSNGTTIQ